MTGAQNLSGRSQQAVGVGHAFLLRKAGDRPRLPAVPSTSRYSRRRRLSCCIATPNASQSPSRSADSASINASLALDS
jgi:hypothetical protein